jgi:hypothetical protein
MAKVNGANTLFSKNKHLIFPDTVLLPQTFPPMASLNQQPTTKNQGPVTKDQ